MSRRLLALSLATLVVVEVTAAVVLTVVAGWSFDQALEAFVVSNSVLGLSFGLCGAVVAWHRPANPIGWLLGAGGLLHGLSALAVPLGQVLYDGGAPDPVLRLLGTVFACAWPWSIALCLPLFLLLFPDGQLPSKGWRWAVLFVVVTAPVFAVPSEGLEPFVEGAPTAYLALDDYDRLDGLWAFGEARTLGSILLGVVALLVRYRRADEVQRRQILWLLLAAVVVLAFIAPWSFVAGTPIFVLFSIPLIPLAVAVAIVRHGLLDIRLVVSRVVTWALLSAGAVATYVVLVGLLDGFVSARLGRSAAATVLVALAMAPVLPRLQGWVDRRLYGDRRDPARLLGRVEEGLSAVVASVCETLRLPYAGLLVDGQTVAETGQAPERTSTVTLRYAGRDVGELVVGLRSGERTLSSADQRVLDLVSGTLAVAVELQGSRDRLVAAREDERGRLRRDLHDGLGPHLTGVAMKADAARNLLASDPDAAAAMVAALGRDTRGAIAEVRRVIDGLRPAALDELGLLGALQERVDALGSTVAVRLEAPPSLPALPEAIEVAAYRVATEALNNVVRHARARAATIRLQAGEHLDVEVTDDGRGQSPWSPGVGLQAMSARAAELGGTFEAGPDGEGGRVRVSFPLGVS